MTVCQQKVTIGFYSLELQLLMGFILMFGVIFDTRLLLFSLVQTRFHVSEMNNCEEFLFVDE